MMVILHSELWNLQAQTESGGRIREEKTLKIWGGGELQLSERGISETS